MDILMKFPSIADGKQGSGPRSTAFFTVMSFCIGVWVRTLTAASLTSSFPATVSGPSWDLRRCN